MKTDRAKLKLRIVAAIRGERGVSMLEFAFIALPLFMFIFGILEVGLIFWGTYELDIATLSAARTIRTGQAQNAGMTQTQMIAQICSQTSILSNCTDKLQLNVQSFPDFSDVTAPTPLDRNRNLEDQLPLPARRDSPRSISSRLITSGP